MVNVTNFTGNYTLDNLRPYTEYSVYVTAVRLIGTTGRPLEGEKSKVVNSRTLAGGLLHCCFLRIKVDTAQLVHPESTKGQKWDKCIFLATRKV